MISLQISWTGLHVLRVHYHSVTQAPPELLHGRNFENPSDIHSQGLSYRNAPTQPRPELSCAQHVCCMTPLAFPLHKHDAGSHMAAGAHTAAECA